MSQKALVFIKEVPDTDQIEIDYENGRLKREKADSIINPDDFEALKWALWLKNELDFKLTVVTMGPLKAISSLQYCLALGADEAVLLSDPAFGGSDTLATSTVLKAGVDYLGKADVYLMGHQSLDGDTAQVPPQVAELLGIPSITQTLCIRDCSDTRLASIQKLGDDIREMVTELPVVLGFQSPKKNEMLLPPARKYFNPGQVRVLSNQELKVPTENIGLKGSPTKVTQVKVPGLEKRLQKVENATLHWIREISNVLKNS